MSFSRPSTQSFLDSSFPVRKKIKVYVVLVVISFLVILMRIWYLQILKGEDFMGQSEQNRVRKISLADYRGDIKDRLGNIIVNVRPSFSLYVTPEDADNLSESLEFLSGLIEINKDKLRKDIRLSPSFKNVLIKRDISRREVAYIEENKMLLPGIRIKVEPIRNYAHKDFASHVLGYLGEVSKSELKTSKFGRYELGDMVGKNGLEKIYESELRGKKGFKEVEVDVSGRELIALRKLSPKTGNSLVLTLDRRVQGKLETLMDEVLGENSAEGSAVVMNVQSGEIFAIVSKPSFDPNSFAAGISKKKWNSLVIDEKNPLQNRTIDGQYPPASTYKVVAAYAALSEKIIKPEQVLGKKRPGKKIGISGDTMPTKELEEFFNECDYLVFDSTFLDEEKQKAQDTCHSTAKQAAELGKNANVKNLILTHFSARYKDEIGHKTEAEQIHNSVITAKDLLEVEIS